MNDRRKYTDEEFIEAVKASTSIMDVLPKLGLAKAGGNFELCKKRILQLKLDTSHFLGRGWKKGLRFGPRKPISDYLKNGTRLNDRLKNRLFEDGLFVRKCHKCSNTHWMDVPISLEIHHIDGNHFNNELTNITMLCPNCHSQTETFKHKNWGRYDNIKTLKPQRQEELRRSKSRRASK